MKNKLYLALVVLFTSFISSAQNNETCLNMTPFCLGTTYTSATGGASEPGNDYGCLGSQPNPSWYFLKSGTAGQINLGLSAASDIDFIIYGPFDNYADITNECGILGGVNSPIVDCSYSGSNLETLSINSTVSGEYYLLLVTNYANQVQDISLTQISGTGTLDCSVYSEAGYQNISGTIFYDEDQNGIFDNSDLKIPNAEYNILPANFQGYSDMNGVLNYYIQTIDTIDYTVGASYQDWGLTTSPSQYQFTLDTTNSIMDSLFFGFYPTSVSHSGTIDFINSNTLCASTTQSWISVANTGSGRIYTNFQITLPTEIELTYSEYPYDSIINNTIYFSRDTLNLFENQTFSILTQPVTVGSINPPDTLIYYSNLTVHDGNENLISSQTDSIFSAVGCSYDPNDKTAFPNGNTGGSLIQPDDYIEYLIRFQNTGTAAAVNITIEDTLSENLDISTFHFMSASFPPIITIDEDRLLTFKFDNIMLPDSNSNEPESHGYIKFYIESVSGLLPHDSINNTAYIYFDYNAAIVTNTAHNIIDCYITPPVANFSLVNDNIQSNLNDPDYSFIWLFNGDTLLNETENTIPNMGNGEYTLLVSNQFNCETISNYSLSLEIQGVDESRILIYPTPTKSNLNIELSNATISQIDILDETGKLIKVFKDINSYKYIIPETVLQPGVYFINIKNTNGKSYTKKIIKI